MDLTVTLVSMLGGERVVCHTRDVSERGMSLDTGAWFQLGTRLSIVLTDDETKLELVGDVVREAQHKRWLLGVSIIDPPPEWQHVVARAARASGSIQRGPRRMRVLVVGDEDRQRSAQALYVTSGWDVLFASDTAGVEEALGHVALDAVISELDVRDARIADIMAVARRIQPSARRIVRGRGRSEGDLVHRFVDRDGGLEPLLDAVTARERQTDE